MRRRRVPPAVALALLLVVVAGCGGLPLAAGVRTVRTLSAGALADGAGDGVGNGVGDGAPGVRVLPPPPVPGAAPVDVVRGFLNAQADGEGDFEIAREFLAPGTTWSTAGAVAVYDSAVYPAPAPARPSSGRTSTGASTAASTTASAAASTVTVTLGRTASLDASGTYTPRADRLVDTFRLVRADGQWRIVSPPPGLQLTPSDLVRLFQPSTLWWYAPDLATLVPELRWLPTVTAGRQTQLVRALLGGPGSGLAGAVRTAVPAGAALYGSVATVGADVVVDLSQAAAALGADQARRLLVQLASTLEQAPSGTAVRLEVDGQPLPAAGAPQRLAFTGIAGADPDTALPAAPSVALVGGRITAVAGAAPVSAPAVASLAGRRLTVAVPSPGDGRIAAVERVAATERVVVASATGPVVTVGGPGAYGRPSWSSAGTLVVPAAAGLLVARPGSAPVVVAYPSGIGPVRTARLARDGVRLLLVAGVAGARTAYLATLVTGGGGVTIGRPVAVSTGMGEVLDAGWQGATTVALLVAPGAGDPPALLQLAADGSQGQSVALPATVGVAALTLAAAPGVPLLVGGAGVVAQLTRDDGWRTVLRGSAPAAPG